jgi:hypothetical protein
LGEGETARHAELKGGSKDFEGRGQTNLRKVVGENSSGKVLDFLNL